MEGKFQVAGGRMKFDKLTNQLSDKDYAVGKIVVWLQALKDGMKPIKWFKSNKQGTKMEFEYIKNQEDADRAMAELKGFIRETNLKYDLDLKLK